MCALPKAKGRKFCGGEGDKLYQKLLIEQVRGGLGRDRVCLEGVQQSGRRELDSSKELRYSESEGMGWELEPRQGSQERGNHMFIC